MADVDFLIQILARLKDEAGPGIAKLKAEIDSLKNTQDAERGTDDLADSIDNLGKKSDDTRKKHEARRKEEERGTSVTKDVGRAADDAAEKVDRSAKAHDRHSESASGARRTQEEFGDELDKVKNKSDDTKNALAELDKRMKSLTERRDELNQKSFLPDDISGLNKQREAYADLDRQIKSLSNTYSRFATDRKEGEESLRSDAIKKAEEGFIEAAKARAEVDRLQKLVPASRQPTVVDTAARVAQIKADEKAADAQKDLEYRTSSTLVAFRDLDKELKSGQLTKGEAEIRVRNLSNALKGLSRETDVNSASFRDISKGISDANKLLKDPNFGSTGGIAKAFGRGFKGESSGFGEGLESLSHKFDDLGVRITGVSSFLRGFFDLAKIGLSQQLITGVISLAGGLVAVGSAAVQAGAALAGVFISGLGQIIPMASVAIAAMERFKNILQAVSVAGQAEQQHFYDPTEKQVTQLQNISQLISAQQQLSNSAIQLYEAQQRVRDSQIQLTEARYTAQRQITELSLAEKNARLQAEGANLSLAESRRQLTIAIQRGDASGIQQAELAVKEAELGKKKAEYEIPKAQREARLARQRGVSGAPSVIGAVEGLEGARVAVLQAQQAGEAAKRQEQIVQLQQAARSSKETTYEAQLKFLKKGMSPTELGLTDALIGIEKELKSPDSPLKKITDYFVEPFTNAVERIRSLLKNSSFLGPIDELAKAMGAGLGRLEKATYGAGGTNFFETMARDASKNIPVVVGAIEHLMHLFEDIAKAADPAFHKLSEDWNNFWGRLDKKDSSAEGITRLEKFFNKSAEYAEKFASLGAALFGLFKAIGSDAAPQGIITVTSFTEAIKSATEWVKSHGSEVTKFFREAREGLSVLGQLLFGIGTTLIQVFSLDSLKAFSQFIQQILLPAAKDVVNILGKLTEIFMKIIDAIPGGRQIFEGLAALFLGIAGLSKAIGPIIKMISLFKDFRLAVIATSIVMKDMGVISSLTKIKTAVSAIVDQYKLLKGEAIATATTIEATSTAEAASISEVTAAEAGAVGGEAAVGAGGAGLLGGAAGLAGKAVLPIAALYAATQVREGAQQTGSSGLPIGSTSLFGGQFSRYSSKELGNLEHLQIGKFVSGILGTSNDESGSENKLRRFGNEVEKLKGHLSSLPESKLLAIQHEAESLSNNPALSKWSEALKNTANQFNPLQRTIKEFSEISRESFEKLSPAAKGVAETFNSISISTGRIWANIKNVLKENIEAIRENLGTSSKQGKEALAQNFGDAQKKIEEAMEKGTMSTSIGMGRIKKLVSEALSKYGIKPSEIEGSPSGQKNVNVTGGKAPAYAEGTYARATPGGQHATIAEGGHDEVVLSTDPRHAERSRSLLGAYLRAAPHMAEGGPVGYESPFHGAIQWGRSDQGTDVGLTPGSPITAIGEAQVKGIIPNWYAGQPYIWYELLSGMDKGKDIYIAEQINRLAKVGQILKAGQPVAYYAPSGTGIETGWSTSGGATLASSQTGHGGGEATAAGKAFTSFLRGLAAGKVLAGGLGEIIAPHITGGGAIGKVAQNALDIATKAANIFVGKTASAHGGGSGGGLGNIPSGKLGPSNKREFAQYLAQYTGLPIQFLGAWINHEQGSSTVEGGNNWLNIETGGPGGGSGPYGATAKWVERHTPKQAAVLEADWLHANLPQLLRARSAAEAVEILENSGYAESHYGHQSPKEFLSEYATGGIIGDQVRRVAIRHLRKKVLKFAQGGRAPWGGAPVPVIAHEGERIMNPSQYNETARLAGTSPGGLDRHLGYDSTPRQHFADGGIPTVTGYHRQPTSGSSSFSVASINEELNSFNVLMSNPGSTESIKKITKIFKLIEKGFKNLKLVGKDNEKYVTELNEFIKNIVIETSGILAKLKEGREYVKTNLERSKVEAEFSGIKPTSGKGYKVTGTSESLQALESLKTIKLGPGGEVGAAQTEVKSLTQEGREMAKESNLIKTAMAKVKAAFAQAEKIKNSSKRSTAINMLTSNYAELIKQQRSLTEEMNSNIEARYQAEVQVLQDKITQANTAYQTISQEQQTAISGAQSMGNLGQVGSLESQLRKSAESQLNVLGPLLQEAERIGNTELAASIKQEMTSLRQTITNAVVESITNAQTLIQREAGSAEAKTSMLQSLSKVSAQYGNFSEAGSLEKQALENKGSSLSATRAQEEQLREQALREGDTAAVITLNEELDKNSAEIAENNLALKENAVVTRELVLNQIQATGQFKTGIYGAAQQGLEILGKTTGYMNVGGLLSAAKGKEGSLGTERSELEGQAGGMGLGVEGMTPAQILSYLASPEGQNKLKELEKGEDKAEKEQMYKLVDALESNATATLKNTEEIAKLNGQLNQPQTWSTTAWQNFRGAFFGGMGNLLPQYSSVLPPGAQPTEMPVYGSASPGPSAGTNIGSINLTHPVEKLDPGLLGEELSYHIGTTPSMG